MKRSKKEIKYIYSEEFKTNIIKPTEEQLNDIFNRKIFKTIMKIEKFNFGGCNVL